MSENSKFLKIKVAIGCHALCVHCIIGVHPEERLQPQQLLIHASATLHLDFTEWQDEMEATVSYTLMADLIAKTLITGQFHLLETAAFEITNTLFQQDARISEITLTIEKQALSKAACAYVTMTRSR